MVLAAQSAAVGSVIALARGAAHARIAWSNCADNLRARSARTLAAAPGRRSPEAVARG
jgi:hypothetical protein